MSLKVLSEAVATFSQKILVSQKKLLIKTIQTETDKHSVCKTLEENSCNNAGLTWSDVIDSILKGIHGETERTTGTKSTVTVNLLDWTVFLASLIKKVETQEEVPLGLSIVKSLFAHITDSDWEDPPTISQSFVRILSSLIPKYHRTLTRSQFFGFLGKLAGLVLANDNPEANARSVALLVQNFDLSPKDRAKIFLFWEKNFFSQSQWLNNRYIMIGFNHNLLMWSVNEGSTVFDSMQVLSRDFLSKWNEFKKDTNQIEYLQYFRLLVQLSHGIDGKIRPIGVLHDLNDFLRKMIAEAKAQYSSFKANAYGTRSSIVDTRSFLDLASDTFATTLMLSKQISSQELAGGEPAKKKKKIFSLDQEFISNFDSPSGLAWIQIFCFFIRKYPTLFDLKIQRVFLDKFCDILKDTKDDNIAFWCFQSLIGLAVSIKSRGLATQNEKAGEVGPLKSPLKPKTNRDQSFGRDPALTQGWKTVVQLMLTKFLLLRTEVACCMKLLSIIILYQLVDREFILTCQAEFWKLLTSNGSVCTIESTAFLIHFIEAFELRDENEAAITGERVHDKIITWLLGSWNFRMVASNDSFNPDLVLLIAVAIAKIVTPEQVLPEWDEKSKQLMSSFLGFDTLKPLDSSEQPFEALFNDIEDFKTMFPYQNPRTQFEKTEIVAKQTTRSRKTQKNIKSKLKDQVFVFLQKKCNSLVETQTSNAQQKAEITVRALHLFRVLYLLKPTVFENMLAFKFVSDKISSFIVGNMQKLTNQCLPRVYDVVLSILHSFPDPMVCFDLISSGISSLKRNINASKTIIISPQKGVSDEFDQMEVEEPVADQEDPVLVKSCSLMLIGFLKKLDGKAATKEIQNTIAILFLVLGQTNDLSLTVATAQCLLSFPLEVAQLSTLVMSLNPLISCAQPAIQEQTLKVLTAVFMYPLLLTKGCKKLLEKCCQYLKKILEVSYDWNCSSVLAQTIRTFLVHIPEPPNSVSQLTEAANTRLVLMLKDPDQRVRRVMSKTITILFEIFSAHDEVYKDIEKTLSPILTDHESSPETICTALMTLAEIAVVSPSNETSIVDTLLSLTSRGTTKPMIPAILDYISSKLAFSSQTSRFINCEFRVLIHSWVKEQRKIDDFPFELFGYESLIDLVNDKIKMIIPTFCLFEDKTNLLKVSTLIQKDVKALIATLYPQIFAYCFTYYFTPEKDKARSIFTKFIGKFGVEKIEDWIPKNIARFPEILETLLDLAGKTDFVQPFFARSVLDKVFDHLAKGHEKTISQMFYKTSGPGKTIALFNLSFNQQLASAHRISFRIRVFDSFEFFVKQFEIDVLSKPSVLRDVLHTILRSMQYPELKTSPYVMLSSVVSKVPSTELAPHIPFIVPHLVKYTIENPSNPKPALDLIQFFLNSDVASSFVAVSDPFPETEVFKALNAQFHKLRGKYDIIKEINRFLRSATSKTVPIEISGLQYLHQQLSQRRDELITKLESNPEKITSTLMPLIWPLIRLCGPQHDPDIRLAAGECLGEIGSINPGAITFFAPHDFLSSTPTDGAPAPAPEALLLIEKVNIVRLLASYLTSPSVELMVNASQSLKGILSSPSAQAIAAELGEDMSKLNHFASSKPYAIPRDLTPGLPTAHSNELWTTNDKSYYDWITTLTFVLANTELQHETLRLCANVCLSSSEFAEISFPLMIEDLIKNKSWSDLPDLLTKHVLSPQNQSVEAIQLLINTLNVVRSNGIQQSGGNQISRNFWASKFWQSFNFLDIVSASQRCCAFFSSLMFLESWCEITYKTLSGFHEREDNEENRSAKKYLMEIFSSINEPDSFYGVEHAYDDIRAQIIREKHEGHWDDLIGTYDLVLSDYNFQGQKANNTQTQSQQNGTQNNGFFSSNFQEKENINLHKEMLMALQNNGQTHLLHTYMKSTHQNPVLFAELSEFYYQEAWKNCQWNIYEQSPGGSDSSTDDTFGFHHAAFLALRALKQGDESSLEATLKKIRLQLVQNIGILSVESTKNIFPVLNQLQFFQEIQNIWELKKSQNSKVDLLMGLQKRWESTHQILVQNEFESIEPILSLRAVLLQVCDCWSYYPSYLGLLAKIARKAKRIPFASQSIYRLKSYLSRTEIKPQQATFDWCVEEAKVIWSRGQHNTAIQASKTLIRQFDVMKKTSSSKQVITQRRAELLLLAGKWLADTKMESHSDISKQYFRASISEYTEIQSDDLSKAFFATAQFADDLYEEFVSRQSSSEWQSSQRLRELKEREFQQLSLSKPTEDSILHHLHRLKKEIEIDKAEEQIVDNNKIKNLQNAIMAYASCLIKGEKYDVRAVFRFISLWFSNISQPKINEVIRKFVPQIASYKFLPLFYQIASRMSNTKSIFQDVLNEVIEYTTTNHPHHALYQIFALANAGQVSKEFTVDKDKMKAAQSMLRKIVDQGKAKKTLSPLVHSMEKLVGAYNQFASADVKKEWTKYRRHDIPLPKSYQIAKLPKADLNVIHVPTTNLPISKSGDYSQITPIGKFESHFNLVGGVHLPKIISCYGTNGKKYKQLVKGAGDDLRQDAVMEQMFGLVNTLLTEERETRKRSLTIRTYKVIPMSPCSGILEWVNDTMPLGTWLVGPTEIRENKDCGHYRYYPKDWNTNDCRVKFKDSSKKLETYLEICDHFHPVLHHFFVEKFLDPAQWFEKRLNYTRSVATGSMVGYVLGLGDRHSQNILIDTNSGEIVHIDLGVAFDQGKALPTPELVPFRLTRDIVDGMGITGVEGVFRRCCEETLQVLRTHKSRLMTLVEVFIHDPLYKWTLSTQEALRRQHSLEENLITTDQQNNNDAERTMLRVKQKLEGSEFGQTLDAQVHVRQLIQAATDPNNLCKMFHGWAPWV